MRPTTSRRVYNAPMNRPAILFICIGNTCRSPMAEAITRGLSDGEVEAFSAGLMPFGRIVEPTVATLTSLGYDATALSSKGLDEVDLRRFDVVVSLLGQAGLGGLPTGLGAELESWDIRDPYGEDDEVYLAVAHELERRIGDLLADHLHGELPIL